MTFSKTIWTRRSYWLYIHFSLLFIFFFDLLAHRPLIIWHCIIYGYGELQYFIQIECANCNHTLRSPRWQRWLQISKQRNPRDFFFFFSFSLQIEFSEDHLHNFSSFHSAKSHCFFLELWKLKGLILSCGFSECWLRDTAPQRFFPTVADDLNCARVCGPLNLQQVLEQPDKTGKSFLQCIRC